MKRVIGEGRVRLCEEIRMELEQAAKEAFDPETAIDSDGYDQGVREGIERAYEIIKKVLLS